MRAVGIKVLNSRLSEFVRIAAAGDTVLITDRSRVVAELGPPRETRSPQVADARLAAMVRRGLLTPPTLAQSDRPRPMTRAGTLATVLRGLDEDRADRDLS